MCFCFLLFFAHILFSRNRKYNDVFLVYSIFRSCYYYAYGHYCHDYLRAPITSGHTAADLTAICVFSRNICLCSDLPLMNVSKLCGNLPCRYFNSLSINVWMIENLCVKSGNFFTYTEWTCPRLS